LSRIPYKTSGISRKLTQLSPISTANARNTNRRNQPEQSCHLHDSSAIPALGLETAIIIYGTHDTKKRRSNVTSSFDQETATLLFLELSLKFQIMIPLLSKEYNGDALSRVGKFCCIDYPKFWGFVCLQYNLQTGVTTATSKRTKCRWKITILIAMLWRIYSLFNLFFGMSHKAIIDIAFGLIKITLFAFSGFLHCHTIRKVNSLENMLNTMGPYKIKFKGNLNLH